MKFVIGILLSTLLLTVFADTVFAAIPPERDAVEYVAPTESMTVLRGRVSLCNAERPHGKSGLSFVQLGRGHCPAQPSTAVGWDRPEEESTSPGIPFRGRGL